MRRRRRREIILDSRIIREPKGFGFPDYSRTERFWLKSILQVLFPNDLE
jgi:hypothetical protein